MARNHDGQFFESENLKIPNPVLPDEEVPAAEEQIGEVAPPEEPEEPVSPAPESVPEPDEDEAEEADEPEEDESDAAILQERVRIADDAWDDEARRVDTAQPGKARAAWEEEDSRKRQDRGEEPKPSRKSPEKKKRKRKGRKKKISDDRRGFVKSLLTIVICGVLFFTVAMLVISNFVDSPLLTVPRRLVTSVVTPVQRVFASVTDSVVDYLRMLKIRSDIEYQYEQLTLMLDDYATMNAQNEEYRRTIQELYAVLDEQDNHREMSPIMATVIATDSGNYFSTLSLDVGSSSGVGDYMAVVAQGGLVGVTYDVEENTCKVRCIINSDCTVAALIQSTRDQGSVKGTLGITGEAMLRMYYLPDNSVARPGDMVVTSGVGLEFPKGIPIGEVRESTRGMEDNKSYVVIEPVVDFQHLEYVTVYRYRPAYAEAAQSRSGGYTATLEPLASARPIPTISVGGTSDFLFSQEPSSEPTPAGETPSPSPTPTATPEPSATPDPNATPTPENLTYQAVDPNHTETPSPRPTFTPTPSPVPTQDPGGMTVEDD